MSSAADIRNRRQLVSTLRQTTFGGTNRRMSVVETGARRHRRRHRLLGHEGDGQVVNHLDLMTFCYNCRSLKN